MVNKTKSTCDEFIASLSAKETKKFNKEHRELLLSELLLAAMEQDNISVRKLAKLADISPTIVQSMRSGEEKDFSMQSFFKILRGLGCKKLMIELHGQLVPLNISNARKS